MQLPSWARPSEKDSSDFTVVVLLVFHFFIVTSYPSLAWADELFQTVEQGHRLAFGYGVIPWEFRDGIRSWVLPGLLGIIIRATAFLGSGSTGYLIAIRIFLCLCSMAPVVATIAWARRAKLPYPWIAGIAVGVWFELVFFAGKALTEVFAAYAVPAALYYCVVAREEGQKRAGVLAGLAWGLAVGLRVHLAPAAAVAMLWTCRKDLARWKPMVLGFGGVIVFFGAVDWATWTYPFQSFFLNFWVNVVEGKAATFGVSPPWEYLASLGAVWHWAAIPLLVLAMSTFSRWPILGVTALVIFVTHTAIAHKEYRFLAPFLVIVVMAASLELLRLLQTKRVVGVAACVVWLLASADGARRYDWNDLAPRPSPPESFSMWDYRGDTLRAYEALSKLDSICGFAAVAIGWGWTGGYGYLHHNVPMFEINNEAKLAANSRYFNTLVASGGNGPTLAGFTRGKCWGEVCLYQRPGECDPVGEYSINAMLKAQGH